MDKLKLISKYKDQEEVTLETDTLNFRVEIAGYEGDEIIRIYNLNALDRKIIFSKLYQLKNELNFQYFKIYVNNKSIASYSADHVKELRYRLDISGPDCSTPREFIEYSIKN